MQLKCFMPGGGVPEKHIINFFALVVLVQPDFAIYFHIPYSTEYTLLPK